MSTPIKGRVALSLLAAVASSAAVPLAPSGLRPPLRGLRGGATPSKLLWVRSPDDDTLRVVRSLSSFCEEHELDEDAMLAVSRGEAEDHEGWQCGVASEYEPPTKSAAGKSDGAAEAIEEDEAVEVVETEPLEEEEEEEGTGAAAERPAPPPPQMSKMVIGLVAPMAVLQVLKAFDQSSAEYLMGLRGAFFGIIALNTLVQLLLEWRIAATKDATPVQAPFNPLSMLMGGATKKEQTARECVRAPGRLHARRSIAARDAAAHRPPAWVSACTATDSCRLCSRALAGTTGSSCSRCAIRIVWASCSLASSTSK